MLDIKNIFEGLEECCFDELSEDNCLSSVFDYCSNKVFKSAYSIGATKLVLYPIEDENYVIKIPFTHDSFNYPEEPLPFEGADEPDKWDYCKAETIYYENAEEQGLDFAFVKTEKLGNIDGHPIYMQKKVEMLDERRSSHPKDWKSTLIASNYCTEKSQRCFSSYWLTDFLEYYEVDVLDALYHFLDDFNISDLHEGNLGYLNGVPVIVDYAGYHE